jgi:hypothetical protein
LSENKIVVFSPVAGYSVNGPFFMLFRGKIGRTGYFFAQRAGEPAIGYPTGCVDIFVDNTEDCGVFGSV